ncbi:MAG TPA: exodeoxyribonuclease VII large subunit [Roseiflexaceae bacterium]|nr:exodeoxyribonuclease VII large subunit [Roseiflexaceae bacterium]
MRLLTVSQLSLYLRELLESDDILRDVWVEGEISNFNRHAGSGHCYFSVKDSGAVLRGVMWRSYAERLGGLPSNGDAVLVHGRVSLYEPRGDVQLYADIIQPAGVGLLQAQFERLRARLEAEGLFDPSRKRRLPELPRRIGVATSPTGAALQDILNVLRRRYPLAEVVLAPCQVQGAGAAETVVEALYALYDAGVDVIIVARGGGSAEDLWAFNEEVVARAAFASPVPIVSGVGHETDTTIIDYVADVRAPTPSAAAEIVSPDVAELADAVAGLRAALDEALLEQVARARGELEGLRRRLAQQSPMARVQRDRQMLDELLRRASAALAHDATLKQARLEGALRQLAALSPLATLGRGYAVVRRASDGRVVTSPAQIAPGEAVDITVRDGSFGARRVEG